MWRRKLLSPLSATLRRTLPSASRVSLDSTPQTLLSASLSSFGSLSGEYESRAFTIRRFHFLGNLKFPAENFCLKSVERCWNCNSVAEAAPFLVCENCRSVQPVDHAVDFFQIFGLEKKYQIEVENLEGKYKNWQKILHPDIVHSKSKLKLEGEDADEEKTISEPELLTEMQDKLEHWSRSFATAFQSRNFEEARTSIQRMTYYKRVNEEIVKKL
ncbi:iron-sulfur cluster co-chaperone protein HscB homolog isoform X6 [Actinidia eriantha]|uniref:iron-sulfur cluster co-chaperone protein HscB homolog isoform X6 n=1 Tax=Actinidia eriantha TaxID=165200 RepID=UPI0025893EA9|nr:iron-sulfur cluster co-chaperone protein HscB homolog isoform X6 [Actinidia eriantha]